MSDTKRCGSCKQVFPSTEEYYYLFRVKRAKGPVYRWSCYCKQCQAEKQRASWSKDREGYRKRARERARKNQEYYRKNSIRQNRRCKAIVLVAYSQNPPSCACCGETSFEFLTIDHINGGGRKHRATIGESNIYWHLKRNSFPPGFRVLCMNCNIAYGCFGYCPHKSPGVDIAAFLTPGGRSRSKFPRERKGLQPPA